MNISTIQTKFDVGDKVVLTSDGSNKVGIIESVTVTIMKKQTEWPIMHQPDSGLVRQSVTRPFYTLKLVNGLFHDEDLEDGSHIPNNSI